MEVDSAEGYHSASVQEYYRQLYFEPLDLVITEITDHFDQSGYIIYKNLEGLLVKAANNLCYDECLSEAGPFYKDSRKLTELYTVENVRDLLL